MYEEDYEGWTANPVVYIKDSDKTSVLDKNGEPYSVTRKQTIGFVLKRKDNRGN